MTTHEDAATASAIRFWFIVALISGTAAIVLPNAPARPTSRFTYVCEASPSRWCTFSSTSLGNPRRYSWTFGDTMPAPNRQIPNVKHYWEKAGTYDVRLTVVDSLGQSSYSTQHVTVPRVNGPVLALRDTVWLVKHDTIQILVTIPTALPSVSQVAIDSMAYGQPIRVFSVTLLGMLNRRPDGSVMTFRDSASAQFTVTSGPVSIGVMRESGAYPDLATAVKALLAPPKAGWTP